MCYGGEGGVAAKIDASKQQKTMSCSDVTVFVNKGRGFSG